MNDVMKSFVLSNREIAVLCAKKGFDRIYGFGFEDKLNREDVLCVMNAMLRKKIINSDGDRFSINEPYKTIISVMCNSPQVVVIKGIDKADICIYYGNNQLLKAETAGGNCQRFMFSDVEQLWNELKKNSYFNEVNETINGIDDDCIRQETDIISNYQTDGICHWKSGLSLVFERKSAGGQNNAMVAVIQRELFRYIYCDFGDGAQRFLFSADRLKKYAGRLL